MDGKNTTAERRTAKIGNYTVREGDRPAWCGVTNADTWTGKPASMRVELPFDEVCSRLKDFAAAGGRLRITEVFADQNADVREFLLSGTTPEEWNAIMGETDR